MSGTTFAQNHFRENNRKEKKKKNVAGGWYKRALESEID